MRSRAQLRTRAVNGLSMGNIWQDDARCRKPQQWWFIDQSLIMIHSNTWEYKHKRPYLAHLSSILRISSLIIISHCHVIFHAPSTPIISCPPNSPMQLQRVVPSLSQFPVLGRRPAAIAAGEWTNVHPKWSPTCRRPTPLRRSTSPWRLERLERLEPLGSRFHGEQNAIDIMHAACMSIV